MNNKIELGPKFLTWDIHYKCNYYCPYCFLHFEPETSSIDAVYLKKDQWVRIWSKMYRKYGPFHISVTGGEPFIYPDFIDLISELTRMHNFEFSTNLSWDVNYFTKKVSPKKVKINSSFHPDCVSQQEFLEKVIYLKQWGYQVSITIVAYPPLIDKIGEYDNYFKKTGSRLILYPYRGPYENRAYPKGYTDKERVALKKLGLELGADVNQELFLQYELKEKEPVLEKKAEVRNKSDKKICRMGQQYAKLVPNGEVFRCCAAVNKPWGQLGNIIKGTFEFSSEPLACPDSKYCRCYKAMIIGEEEKWSKDWLTMESLLKIDKERKLLEEAKNIRDHGNIYTGIDKINKVLKDNPDNVHALTLLAEFKIAQKDYSSCEKILRDIIDNKRSSVCESWIYRILGRLYMELALQEKSEKEKRALFDKAGQYLNRALAVANKTNNLSDRAGGHYEMAIFYLHNNNYKMAKENINSALKYEPKNEHFLRVVKQIEKEEEKVWISHYEAAKQLASKGDINNALVKLKVVLINNADNINAMILLAELYLRQKDYSSCQDMLLNIEKKHPDSEYCSRFYRVFGELYTGLGSRESSSKEKESMLSKAQEYLNRAIDYAQKNNDPTNNAWGYYRLTQLNLITHEYNMAKEHIASALRIEPGNKFFLEILRQIESRDTRVDISSSQNNNIEQITFGWDLCYTCNYRCPYCGLWEKKSSRDLLLEVDQWLDIWNRIFNRYGRCRIFMSGGEPSTYPGFYELVRRLTRIHLVDICTNLSWDVDKIIPEISQKDLKISATFHPSFADFEDFLPKVVKLKEYLSNSQIFYVAYPGQIKAMPARSKKFKECGINLIPLPLRGNQLVLNTEDEKKIIEEVTPYSGEKKDYQLQKISPKGKLCRAGQYYAVIRVNGAVDRCSQYQNCAVGNILNNDFKLLDEPLPCEKDYCPIESQWIIS